MRCSVAWETTMVQRPAVSSQKTFGSRNSLEPMSRTGSPLLYRFQVRPLSVE